jgi:predicted alpha/beta hydrolase
MPQLKCPVLAPRWRDDTDGSTTAVARIAEPYMSARLRISTTRPLHPLRDAESSVDH